MAPISLSSFYITGGTVPRGAACYVPRQADIDLLEGLRQGQFCYVLSARQMGKSSLMVRAAARLREECATCVILDLTAIGQNLDVERWYGGLLNQLGQQGYAGRLALSCDRRRASHFPAPSVRAGITTAVVTCTE